VKEFGETRTCCVKAAHAVIFRGGICTYSYTVAFVWRYEPTETKFRHSSHWIPEVGPSNAQVSNQLHYNKWALWLRCELVLSLALSLSVVGISKQRERHSNPRHEIGNCSEPSHNSGNGCRCSEIPEDCNDKQSSSWEGAVYDEHGAHLWRHFGLLKFKYTNRNWRKVKEARIEHRRSVSTGTGVDWGGRDYRRHWHVPLKESKGGGMRISC
jgi:hypothetical protein